MKLSSVPSRKGRNRMFVGLVAMAFVSLSVGGAPVGEESANAPQVVHAHGRIEVDNGEQVPQSVVVFAWPANEALAHLQVGERINLDPIGTAVVGTNGSFDVVVGDGIDLENYASTHGEVNLMVTADNGRSEFTRSFSVARDAESGSDESPTAFVDLGAIGSVGSVAATSVAPGGASVSDYQQKSCASTKVANLGNKWIPVGGLFSTNSGATADFQYSAGQSTALGVAASISSATAGFSASGTSSVAPPRRSTSRPSRELARSWPSPHSGMGSTSFRAYGQQATAMPRPPTTKCVLTCGLVARVSPA